MTFAVPRLGLPRWAGPAMALLVAAVVVGVVAAVDPGVPGRYPSCPLHALTGLQCPGCGTLRGLHALASGDPAGAVARNPLMVASLPFLAMAWLRWAWSSPMRISARMAWAVLAVVVGFGVARNLPFPPFELLRA